MTRRFYWGIATLIILLIGVSVFLLTRTPDTEPTIVYQTPTSEEKKEVDRNIQDAIDKAKKNQPQSVEIEHQEMPHKNSQQNDRVEVINDSVKKVLADDFLEGLNRLDLDLFDSITLPTNDELANYTDEDIKQLYRGIHEVDKKASAIDEEFTKRIEAIHEASYHYDKLDVEKLLQLSNQNAQLRRVLIDWQEQGKQWRQETERISKYGRGF